MSRAGDAVWDSDALLHRTAELTIGYSGAELANLLNEAAILMARSPVLRTLQVLAYRHHAQFSSVRISCLVSDSCLCQARFASPFVYSAPFLTGSIKH